MSFWNRFGTYSVSSDFNPPKMCHGSSMTLLLDKSLEIEWEDQKENEDTEASVSVAPRDIDFSVNL